MAAMAAAVLGPAMLSFTLEMSKHFTSKDAIEKQEGLKHERLEREQQRQDRRVREDREWQDKRERDEQERQDRKERDRHEREERERQTQLEREERERQYELKREERERQSQREREERELQRKDKRKDEKKASQMEYEKRREEEAKAAQRKHEESMERVREKLEEMERENKREWEAQQERDRQARQELERQAQQFQEDMETERREREKAEYMQEKKRRDFENVLVHCMKLFLFLFRRQQRQSSSGYITQDYRHATSTFQIEGHRGKTIEDDNERQLYAEVLDALELHCEIGDVNQDILRIFDSSLLQLKDNLPGSSERPSYGNELALLVPDQLPGGFEEDLLSMMMSKLHDNPGQYFNVAGTSGVSNYNNDIITSVMPPVDDGVRARLEGNAYFKNKKFPEAIKWYSKSINQSPTAAAYGNRAMTYLKLNKFIEAEKDCTQALRYDACYFKAYARRAIARKELGNLKGALKDVNVALELDPTDLSMMELCEEIECLVTAAIGKD